MSSRLWGPGTPPAGAAAKTRGDGSEVDRGTAGAAAPATRSARIVIGMASLMLTLLSLVLWGIFSRGWDGLALLTLIFAATFVWSAGGFRWSFYTS